MNFFIIHEVTLAVNENQNSLQYLVDFQKRFH